VQHGVHVVGTKRGPDGADVVHVPFDQVGTERGRGMARRQVVEDDDAAASPPQRLGRMAADEAGSARDEERAQGYLPIA
jgi:hypothetical protein